MSAATARFRLPDLGEGLTDAAIVRWLVAAGDEVAVDQPVVEVETAKATVEVPVPYAGLVVELHAAEGDSLAVGAPLISVQERGVEGGGQPSGEPGEDRAAAEEAAEGASGAVLVGYGTPPAGGGRRRRRRRARTAGAETAAAPAPGAPPRVLSPVVRRLATDLAVDLAGVRGTGPGGTVTRTDVEAAHRPGVNGSAPGRGTAPVNGTAPASGAALLNGSAPVNGTAAVNGSASLTAPAPVNGTAPVGGRAPATPRGPAVAERGPLRGLRRATADKLARSLEVPDATVWVDVDATEFVALRERLRASRGAAAPGLLALLARFAVAGLRRHPELNSSVQEGELIRYAEVNLGIATQTDDGLVVPVVRAADRLGAQDLHAQARRLTEAARSGTLGSADLTGGTFTLNNYGRYGVDGSSAIINPPEAAILGIGRIIERPWAVDGQLAVRKIAQLSIVFDHRVCDGTAAGGFLRFVADCVEDPLSALADL